MIQDRALSISSRYHNKTTLLKRNCAEAATAEAGLWLRVQENCLSRPEAEAILDTPGTRREGGFQSADPDSKVGCVSEAGTAEPPSLKLFQDQSKANPNCA